MITKHADEVERTTVTMEGVEGTEIQWLVSSDDGAPNFAMRRFTMRPGGRIPLHDHGWEHEIFVLSGRGRAFTADRSFPLGAGTVLYVAPGESHGYENTGEDELRFLCMVPNGAR